MTSKDFEEVFLPFLDYYWSKTHYFLLGPYDTPIRIGQMVLFCSNCFVPNVLLIVDKDDKVIDGFAACGDYEWNGRSAREQLREIGVRLEDEEID